MWHAQQRYAVSCLGCCVLRWTKPQRGSPSRFPQAYLMLLSEIREQTAEASNLTLDEVVKMVDVSTDGCLHLFSDCGPHLRSAESLRHHVMEFCFKCRREVRINYTYRAPIHAPYTLKPSPRESCNLEALYRLQRAANR